MNDLDIPIISKQGDCGTYAIEDCIVPSPLDSGCGTSGWGAVPQAGTYYLRESLYKEGGFL